MALIKADPWKAIVSSYVGGDGFVSFQERTVVSREQEAMSVGDVKMTPRTWKRHVSLVFAVAGERSRSCIHHPRVPATRQIS